ncbi:MAG TPA: hypothetical protein VFA89_18935 [Terriglobales bacterium]|nr:hypothetical protein [Terriglobales bacterium]
MRLAIPNHLGCNVTAVSANYVVALAILVTGIPGTWAQSDPVPQPRAVACIAIMTPTVDGVPGSAVDAAKGVSDLIASYLQGPSLKTVVLEAKLPSLAAEEAKQKNCEPLLITSVHRKSGGHSLMKAFGQAAGTASWNLPYGGGSAASTVARAGTTAGLQTVSSLAQSTKAKDEISFEYRLQSTDGHIQFGPRTEHRTAKADGEDLLTPVVEHAAENIVAQKLVTDAHSSDATPGRAGHDDRSAGAIRSSTDSHSLPTVTTWLVGHVISLERARSYRRSE